MGLEKIIIKGARQHNLKNIDVELPRDKFIVVTGLSGSGKSSLAFDTIYAEGQRRYVESLSAYARQFLGQMEKPDLDYIEGLSPAISIEQKTTSRNPRSTVGTVTEIYDYLRLLFARCGIPHCPVCGKPITSQTIDQIIEEIYKYPIDTKLQILSPYARGRKGEYKKELEYLKKEGFTRAFIDGEIRELEEKIKLDKNIKHNIDVIIDRIKLKKGIRERLADSLETALRLSDGLVKILVNNEDEPVMFSEKFSCPEHGISIEELQPRLFSFNSPFGACPDCHGIGERSEFDRDLIIPDMSLSINEGGIVGANSPDSRWQKTIFTALSKKYKFSLDVPMSELSEEILDIILYGSGDEKIDIYYESSTKGMQVKTKIKYEGIVNTIARRYRETTSESQKAYYQKFQKSVPCPTCKGKRLKKEVLCVTIAGKSIIDITEMNIKEEKKFFQTLELDEKRKQISEKIFKEITERLHFLESVGLDYITLDRQASTLSGGEAQRIRLATQIGSSLVGVLYILDEPTIGLHQRDNKRLIDTLLHLRNIGNTLIVVEHDDQTILSSDYVVDLGPGAGIHGGKIVALGTPQEIMDNENSLTGKYLTGKLKIEPPAEYRQGNGKNLALKQAHRNNLKNIDVEFPLGKFIAITGVSGSGKSTLVNDILFEALKHKLGRKTSKSQFYSKIEGYENIDKIINIDQTPIGRTPRSNPATYTGVFDPIRDLFASMPEAKIRGYKKGRFSFNVKGGRCEACRGDGQIKIEMHFLPDIYVTCDICKGRRYNKETLEIKYKGLSISDVLNLSIEEAMGVFENIPKVLKKLQTLNDVGLGYIKLGQSAVTLSGGEAQRVKLASELSKRSTGKTFYLLDEPTTGLHFDDVSKLVGVLLKFVEAGNTVLVIEHNLDVIKMADHIIDLGPEGGDAGGNIVFEGTPLDIIKCKDSYTGKYLKDVLKGN